MPAWMAQHVAAVSGISGIDVDATTPASAWLAARSGSLQEPYVFVRSVWVPLLALRSERSEKLIAGIAKRQPGRFPLIVAMMPAEFTLHDLSRALETSRDVVDSWPLAIGLSSASLRGGRPHLVQLGAFKRYAEEWELSLAVDLSGHFDPAWEAEAAIARVGDRLRVLRLHASAPSRAAIGLDRVACRALHAAIDRGQSVDIAVCPGRLGVLPFVPRQTGLGAQRAVAYITERAAMHARALREGIDHFEGSPSPRGNERPSGPARRQD